MKYHDRAVENTVDAAESQRRTRRELSGLAAEMEQMFLLRGVLLRTGTQTKLGHLDRIISHLALALAAIDSSDAECAFAKSEFLRFDMQCHGVTLNAPVTTLIDAALANEAERFGPSGQPELHSMPPLPLENPGATGQFTPSSKRARASVLQPTLTRSVISMGNGPDRPHNWSDDHKIAKTVLVRPAQILTMSLAELLTVAHDLHRKIARLHARGRGQHPLAVLPRLNLVTIAICSIAASTGQEAAARIQYAASYPGVFDEKTDNLRTMLHACVLKDSGDWDINVTYVGP